MTLASCYLLSTRAKVCNWPCHPVWWHTRATPTQLVQALFPRSHSEAGRFPNSAEQLIFLSPGCSLSPSQRSAGQNCGAGGLGALHAWSDCTPRMGGREPHTAPSRSRATCSSSPALGFAQLIGNSDLETRKCSNPALRPRLLCPPEGSDQLQQKLSTPFAHESQPGLGSGLCRCPAGGDVLARRPAQFCHGPAPADPASQSPTPHPGSAPFP